MRSAQFLLFTLLFSGIMSGMIAPDHTNPAQLTTKVGAGSQVLTLKFKLPANSSLPMGGYIGLNFTNGGADFTGITANSYSCAITNSAGTSLSIVADTPLDGILFCKFTDMTIGNMLKSSDSYTLTLTFNVAGRPASFEDVGLFTASDKTANRIYVDETRVFSTVGNYGDYTSTGLSNPLTFTSGTKITAGTATSASTTANIEPFIKDTFDLTLKININTRIPKVYDFILEFDSTYFTAPTSVVSEPIDANSNVALQQKVTGTLSLETVSVVTNTAVTPNTSITNMRVVGIAEDLVPNRSFNLKFSGMTALERVVASSAVTFKVLYKNSNTVFSYHSVANALKVKENLFETPVFKSVENYPYIVAGMAWPVTIGFTPKISSTNTHVVVKTVSATDIEFKFIASTCDFSAAGSTTFGDAPVCHPFDSSSQTGFHFLAPSLTAGTAYSFNVWIHASKCHADALILGDSGDTFSINVDGYSTITNASNGDGILAANKIASGSAYTSGFKCLQGINGGNVMTASRKTHFAALGTGETATAPSLFVREISDLVLNSSNNAFDTATPKKGILGDITLKKDNDAANTSNTAGGFTLDTSDATNAARVYLNTTSTFTSGTTYTQILGRSGIKGNANAWAIFPGSMTYHGTPAVLTGHNMEIIFKKSWFAAGKKIDFNSEPETKTANDLCWVGWTAGSVTANNQYTITYKKNITWQSSAAATDTLTIADDATLYTFITQHLSNGKADTALNTANFLYQGKTTGTLDLANSKLPATNDTHSYYTIKSVAIGSHSIFELAQPHTTTTSNTYFSLFTNCLTFKNKTGDKTIFDTFEVQITMRLTATGPYTRLIRLISLNVMNGAYHGGASALAETETKSFSQVVDTSFANWQSVCVTGIPTALKGETVTGTALVTFLTGVRLLDTDYSTRNNTYPVGNIKDGVSSYGFSAVFAPMETDVRVSNSEFKASGYTEEANLALVNLLDFYLYGSQLWMTAVASNDPSSDSTTEDYMLIPHYCADIPVTSPNNLQSLATFAFVDATNYASVAGKVVSIWKSGTDTRIARTTALTNDFNATNTPRRITPQFATKSLIINASTNNSNSTTTLTNPKAVVLLTTTSVTYEATVNSGVPSVAGGLSLGKLQVSAKPAYFMGKKYDKAALGLVSTTAGDFYTNGATTQTGSFTISNVVRPDLSTLFNTTANTLSLFDIAFVSFGTESYTINNILGKTVSILSLADASSSISWTVAYSTLDNTYHDNYAVKSVVTSSEGVTINNNSEMIITFNTENADSTNTICAIGNVAGQYPRACSNVGTLTGVTGVHFKCLTTSASTSYDICCFNTKIPSGNTFQVNHVQVQYATPTETSAASPNMVLYKKANSTKAEQLIDAPEQNPTFTSIVYNHSNTNGGISTAILTVDLKKRLSPNNTITILGDFTGLLVYGKTPRCSVSTKLNGQLGDWTKGDEIIESCQVDFSSTTTGITIVTKNVVMDCSSSYNSTLYVALSPVKVTDISTKTYTVDIKLAGTSLIPSTVTAATNPVSSVSNLTRTTDGVTSNVTPEVVDTTVTTHTFCNITTIYPIIVGAKADYTFEFDFTSIQTQLTSDGRLGNELTIFLPEDKFGQLQGSHTSCTTDLNTPINCTWDHSRLNINFFNKDITPTATNKFKVTIKNIPNVKLTTRALNYVCTVNRTTTAGVRAVVAYGRGEYAAAIPTAVPTASGKLVFETVSVIPTTATNPRATGRIEFGVTFDKASLHTTILSGEQSNSPGFLFEFPQTYPFIKYIQSNATVEIRHVLRDTTATTFVLSSAQTIANGKPTVYGNLMFMPFDSNVSNDNSKYNFSSELQYWSVIINLFDHPDEEIIDSGILNVYLTNSDHSLLYRTFPNTNNSYYGKIVQTSAAQLNYYRGLRFEFDKKNWVIDISNTSANAMTNNLQITAGFFTPIVAKIRNYENLDEFSGELTLSMASQDLNLSFGTQDIKLFTIKDEVRFEIGVPCGTPLGMYMVDVTVTKPDTQNVRGIAQRKIPIKVMHKIEQITCTLPSISVPRNTVSVFRCDAPRTVDSWDVNFVNKDNNESITGAVIEKEVKGTRLSAALVTVFTDNSSTIRSINYTATSTNSCLWMSTSSASRDITFNLDLDATLAPLLQTDLDNTTFKTRANDTEIAYDAIQFNMTIPIYTRVFVVIVCSSEAFPGDADIKIQSRLTAGDKLAFFEIYSENSTTVHSRTVTGLRRNTNYKVKAILSSASTGSNAPEISKTWQTMNRTGETTASDIKLVDPIASRCLQFNLYSDISAEAKQRLVNFCQNKYNVNSSVGCMVCSDFELKIKAVGSILDRAACGSTSALRMLQTDGNNSETPTTETPTTETPTTPTTPAVTKTVTAAYLVCAVQNFLCSTQLDDATSESTFNTFKDAVDTSAKINAAITVPASTRMLQNAPAIDLASVTVVQDTAVPEFTVCPETGTPTAACYKAETVKFEFLGNYEFKLTFHDSFDCRYAILEDTGSLPTATQITQASSNKGSFFTAAGITQVIKVEGTGAQRFTRAKTFGLFVNCPSRRVPGAKTTNENVIKVASKNFPTLNKSCPLPDLDLDKDVEACTCNGPADENGNTQVVSQGEDGSACSSVFVQLAFVILILSAFLL